MKAAFHFLGNRIVQIFATARQISLVGAEFGEIMRKGQKSLTDEFPVQKALRQMQWGG